jgi:hypothetical protein
MAQLFWEQIRNELPAAGEFLSGSLNISGSFATTGSVLIELVDNSDVLSIKSGGSEKIKVNNQGTLQFISQTTAPTAIQGGMFYSSSNEFYFGFNT